jgi:hypothetical protein
MNIDLTLDYKTILRNEPPPVRLVANLSAPKLEAHTRPRSAAFAVVLDWSGSMTGEPLLLTRGTLGLSPANHDSRNSARPLPNTPHDPVVHA